MDPRKQFDFLTAVPRVYGIIQDEDGNPVTSGQLAEAQDRLAGEGQQEFPPIEGGGLQKS